MRTFFKFQIIVLFIFSISSLSAQVKGLSYTVSPSVEYNWFSDDSGLKNGYLGGAQLGFGFGEYVELRANYMQGFDLETDITKFGLDIPDGVDTSYMSRSVDLRRYGGELKLNLSRGQLLPYVTVGTGIQEIGFQDEDPNKQIYVSGGGGIKFSAANRYTIAIQGANTIFRSNPLGTLLTEEERVMLDVGQTEIMDISNWALRASLELYLGGRKPGQLSDIDKAYYDNFSGGFRGLSIPVEPSLSMIDFHESLNYRSTKLGGISAGINIGPLVGIRGFYWKGLEEESFTDFDDMAMYGGEARFKLNEGKGFTPWITLGGGQIDVQEGYVGRDSTLATADQAFAMGGLGIDLPFSKYVKATGFVRSVLTSSSTLDDLVSSEDVVNSLSYGVSMNFVLGKKSVNVDKANQQLEDKIYKSAQTEFDSSSEALRAEYDAKITTLQKELDVAIMNEDVDAIKEITTEKDLVEQVKSTIPIQSSGDTQKNADNNESIIRMTPAEFQLLLKDLMGSNNTQQTPPPVPVQVPSNKEQSSVENAINDYRTEDKFNAIERQFETVGTSMAEMKGDQKVLSKELTTELNAIQVEFLDLKLKIDALNKAQNSLTNSLAGKEGTVTVQTVESEISSAKMTLLKEQMEEMQTAMQSKIDELDSKLKKSEAVAGENQMEVSNTNFIKRSDKLDNRTSGFASKLTYEGMSGFAGFNLGGNATVNVGYRLHYAVGDADSTKVTFMPETFFGFGSPSAFGIAANLTYDLPFLTKSDIVKPYIGAGLGFMKVGVDDNDDKLKGAYNLIFGTYLNVWKGDMYVDFTARNFFKYNQLVVGYRFPF